MAERLPTAKNSGFGGRAHQGRGVYLLPSLLPRLHLLLPRFAREFTNIHLVPSSVIFTIIITFISYYHLLKGSLIHFVILLDEGEIGLISGLLRVCRVEIQPLALA